MHSIGKAALAAVATAAISAMPLASVADAGGGASGLDVSWIQTAQKGDHFEVSAAKVALRRSKDPAVRKFALRMIADHTESLARNSAVARRIGAKVEDQSTSTQKWEIEMISTLHGAAFDQQYALLEVQDHLDDMSEAQDAIDMGVNATVRREARRELAIYRSHELDAKATLTAVRNR